MKKDFIKKLSEITKKAQLKAALSFDRQRVEAARAEAKKAKEEASNFIKNIDAELLDYARKGRNCYEVCDAKGPNKNDLTVFQGAVFRLLEQGEYPVYIKQEVGDDGMSNDVIYYRIIITW